MTIENCSFIWLDTGRAKETRGILHFTSCCRCFRGSSLDPTCSTQETITKTTTTTKRTTKNKQHQQQQQRPKHQQTTMHRVSLFCFFAVGPPPTEPQQMQKRFPLFCLIFIRLAAVSVVSFVCFCVWVVFRWRLSAAVGRVSGRRRR